MRWLSGAYLCFERLQNADGSSITKRREVKPMQETTQDGNKKVQKIKITITIERTDVVKNENKKTACKPCKDCKR